MAGRLILRGRIYHGRWYVNGRETGKTLKTGSLAIAQKILLREIKKSASGHTPDEDRVTFEDLIEKVRTDHAVRGRRRDDIDEKAAHLKPFFAHMRAVDITTERIQQYVAARLKAGAKASTINRPLALLRYGFNLAELAKKPRFKLVSEKKDIRSDFLDKPDFLAVRARMPEDMRDLITFMYLSSWRFGQVAKMEWRDVDMRAHVVTARGETTKNGEPHRIPLWTTDGPTELWEIIERGAALRVRGSAHSAGSTPVRSTQEICPYVFHRDGKPYQGGGRSPLRKAWLAATAKAGFAGHVLHCLRRSGVRNMINAGIDPMLTMQFSGHKTMSMLARYRIVDIADQQRALGKHMTYVEAQPTEGKVRAIGSRP